MSERREVPQSSLRNNIMIAFFLAIILLGVAITAMSHYILRQTLVDSALPAEEVKAGIEFTWVPEEVKALFDERRSEGQD